MFLSFNKYKLPKLKNPFFFTFKLVRGKVIVEWKDRSIDISEDK